MHPFTIERVLASTDLSDASIPALAWARLFADRFAARLTLVYVDPIVYPIDFATAPDAFFIAPAAEHEAALRADVERHAEPILDARPYDIHVTAGQPVPAILAAARSGPADLLVLGSHARHGWRRAVLGSVSDGVVHGSPCPVLTVARTDRDRVPVPTVSNVVCPINFTDVARDALRVASDLAEAFGARLSVVHVIEPDAITDRAADEEQVRSWIESGARKTCAYRELILRGGPAECVLDCADEVGADLLVVGAQHKLFRDATVIGTTTERLIRFSSCPVLVVPRPAVRHHRKERTRAEAELVAHA